MVMGERVPKRAVAGADMSRAVNHSTPNFHFIYINVLGSVESTRSSTPQPYVE